MHVLLPMILSTYTNKTNFRTALLQASHAWVELWEAGMGMPVYQVE